jgi:hypothetical protein
MTAKRNYQLIRGRGVGRTLYKCELRARERHTHNQGAAPVSYARSNVCMLVLRGSWAHLTSRSDFDREDNCRGDNHKND